MIKAINFTVNFMPIITKIALLFLSSFFQPITFKTICHT